MQFVAAFASATHDSICLLYNRTAEVAENHLRNDAQHEDSIRFIFTREHFSLIPWGNLNHKLHAIKCSFDILYSCSRNPLSNQPGGPPDIYRWLFLRGKYDKASACVTGWCATGVRFAIPFPFGNIWNSDWKLVQHSLVVGLSHDYYDTSICSVGIVLCKHHHRV